VNSDWYVSDWWVVIEHTDCWKLAQSSHCESFCVLFLLFLFCLYIPVYPLFLSFLSEVQGRLALSQKTRRRGMDTKLFLGGLRIIFLGWGGPGSLYSIIEYE
jgi:hypothetical protein